MTAAPAGAERTVVRPQRLDRLAGNARAARCLDRSWIESLDEAALDEVLAYRNMRGEPSRRRMGLLLHRFFNHQTRPRGQATTLLFQAGVDPGVTDLLVLLPLEAGPTKEAARQG